VATITSFVPTHSPAGAAFTLTVNGTNFLSTSTVTFNGKNETTTFVSATKLTVTIPAADASTGGTEAVTVTNPAPDGGPSPSSNFTLDDYTVSGPTTSVNDTKGGPTVQVTIILAPTSNGFPDPVLLTASGFPTGFYGYFSAPTLTPGSANATTTLNMITTAPAL